MKVRQTLVRLKGCNNNSIPYLTKRALDGNNELKDTGTERVITTHSSSMHVRINGEKRIALESFIHWTMYLLRMNPKLLWPFKFFSQTLSTRPLLHKKLLTKLYMPSNQQ